MCRRSLSIMADVAKAPAPVEQKGKPQKPDEKAYKVELESAEKDLAAAQKKFVCCLLQATSYARPFYSRHVRWRSHTNVTTY